MERFHISGVQLSVPPAVIVGYFVNVGGESG
jgi:hypothetical protein